MAKNAGTGRVSRYETPTVVDFNEIQQYQPNIGALDSIMGGLQTEYDSGIAGLSDLAFKNLKHDTQLSNKLREEERGKIDNITESYLKGIGKGRSELYKTAKEISRDYKPGGQRYAINQNYETRAKWIEEQNKRVGKEINQEQLTAAINYYDNAFAGTTKDPLTGAYTQYNTEEIQKYHDVDKIAEDLGKGYMADEVKKGNWSYRGGILWKKTDRGEERVTYDEIMQGVLPALLRNRELMNYTEQYDKFLGRKADYSNVTSTKKGKDGKDITVYNTANPMVGAADRVANKYSFLKTSYNEDIQFDPTEVHKRNKMFDFNLGQQEEKLAREESVQEIISVGGSTKLNRWTGQDALNKDISDKNTKIAEIDKQLSTGRGLNGMVLTKAQMDEMQKEKIGLKNSIQNSRNYFIEVVRQTNPTLAAKYEGQLKAQSNLQSQQDLLKQRLGTKADGVLQFIQQTSPMFTTTPKESDLDGRIRELQSQKVYTKSKDDRLNQQNAKNNEMIDEKIRQAKTDFKRLQNPAALIPGYSSMSKEEKAYVDSYVSNVQIASGAHISDKEKSDSYKGIETRMASDYTSNVYNPVYVSVNQANELKMGTGETKREAPAHKVLTSISTNLAGYKLYLPESGKYIDGAHTHQDAMKKINESLPAGSKIDMSKASITHFTSDLGNSEKGTKLGTSQAVILAVPYVDSKGTVKGTIRLEAGLNDKDNTDASLIYEQGYLFSDDVGKQKWKEQMVRNGSVAAQGRIFLAENSQNDGNIYIPSSSGDGQYYDIKVEKVEAKNENTGTVNARPGYRFHIGDQPAFTVDTDDAYFKTLNYLESLEKMYGGMSETEIVSQLTAQGDNQAQIQNKLSVINSLNKTKKSF